MNGVYEGFWLPRALRQQVLRDAAWETVWVKGGALLGEAAPDAVTVRWPRLEPAQWKALLDGLQQARAVGGRQVLARWQAVLQQAVARLAQQAGELMPLLAAGTGYSPEMLSMALWHGELIKPQLLSAALEFRPTWSAAAQWERMPGLPGRVRFFPAAHVQRTLKVRRTFSPFCRPAPPVELALGYAAGNVPGTALIIALLGGLANYALNDGARAPAVLVRNSRHEPLFAPAVLSIIEALDPELVAALAVLIWDYDAPALQSKLMRQAGLMIAAAGDETIAALDAMRARCAPALRFHRHGHKVSFAVLDTQSLLPNPQSLLPNPQSPIPFLAALDSTQWNQNGCLSARVHFVAGDAAEYARALTEQMRVLAARLPRGALPARLAHRAFDTYTALTGAGRVRVCSTYDDDFAVIVDERAWDAEALRRAVNACQGRVIIVRPVRDALDVPRGLRWLSPANLQSISMALEADRVLEFAEAAGACGITAIRNLGRAAFPQLAYSWDGLLPLDMGWLRPAGHFTTIEFDDLTQELAATATHWRQAFGD